MACELNVHIKTCKLSMLTVLSLSERCHESCQNNFVRRVVSFREKNNNLLS